MCVQENQSNHGEWLVRVRPLLPHENVSWYDLDRSHPEALWGKYRGAAPILLGPISSHAEVYEAGVSTLVSGVLAGAHNGCVFAYGQKGAGKTFTMHGPTGTMTEGVMPRALTHILSSISPVFVSMVDIYNETIFDLLDDKHGNLNIRECRLHGAHVVGAIEVAVPSVIEFQKLLAGALHRRAVWAIHMSATSRRVHSLTWIRVPMQSTRLSSLPGAIAPGTAFTRTLLLVDLAGSSDIIKTANVTKSIKCLGIVLRALSDQPRHVPWRDSKLTRLLQHSLCADGRCRTLMIACLSPDIDQQTESLQTLAMAARLGQAKPSLGQRRREGGLNARGDAAGPMRESTDYACIDSCPERVRNALY
jgi:hypothetical protein